MGLKTKTVKGIGWSVASQVIRLLLNFGIVAVLARMLSPGDFGLIGMVVVFTNLFVILNELGLPAAIVHKQDVTEEHLSSAFWLNLLEGLLLTLILCAAAPFIAGFFERSALLLIVVILSSTLFISSFGRLQQSLFSKILDFKKLAIIDVASTFLSGATAIITAALGFGVWSLVLQSVSLSVFTALLAFLMCSWKPKFLFRWKPVRELLGYGLPLVGFGFVSYFSRNLDNMLIGKYLGAASLGYYAMAYRLLLFPLGNVTIVIGKVMFPAMSTIQDDLAKARSAYVRANKYVAAATFPLMAGLVVAAPAFTRVIIGPKWEESIVLIQILAVVGLAQSITLSINWIYQSQGRTGALLLWGIASTLVCVASFAIGLHWGVKGVATAYLISVLALLYPTFAIPFRFINLRFREFARELFPVVFATAAMVLVLVATRLLMERVLHAGNLAVLVTLMTVDVAAYLGIIALVDRPLLVGMLEVLGELRGARARGETDGATA